MNEGERDRISRGKPPAVGHEGVPWKTLFGSPNLWALCGMYMVTNFNWYFLLYNLPGMLKSQFPHLGTTRQDQLLLGLVGGAPLLVGMLGCLSGGLLTDRYIRRTGDRKWGRRVYGMLGYGLAGVAYAVAALTVKGDSFWVFAASAVAVGFFNDLMMSPAWATAQDIGRRYSAIVSGAMNMVGNLGAVLGLFISGKILKAHSVMVTLPDGTVRTDIDPDGYVTCFLMYAAVYGLGVFAWLLIDATKPIIADGQDHDGAST